MLFTLTTLALAFTSPDPLDQYNLVWTTPSRDASGSMPIGNGVVGANVWVEEGGDLCFYISRTDAWSECDRLLKLGKVRIKLTPNPFEKGQPFKQTLILREGRIEIVAGGTDHETILDFYVNASGSDIYVNGASKEPLTVEATFETWRNQRKDFDNDDELKSSWTMHSASPEVRKELVWESADVITTRQASPAFGSSATNISWYHRNEHSIVPFTLKHQGIDSIAASFPDPLLHRMFGGVIESNLSSTPEQPGRMVSISPIRAFSVHITTESTQLVNADEWDMKLAERYWLNAKDSFQQGYTERPRLSPERLRHDYAWRDFWNRSYIYVDKGPSPTTSHAVPINKHPLRIGADSNGGNKLRGYISRLEIHAAPLSAAQIAVASTTAFKQRPRGNPRPWSEWSAAPRSRGPGLKSNVGNHTLAPIGDAMSDTPAPDMEVFNFRGGHFELPAADSPDFTPGFTLIASVWPEDDEPFRIFDKLTAGKNDGFLFDTHPGDALRLIVGEHTIHAAGVFQCTGFRTVAATYDAATGAMALYLDGKLVKESRGDLEGFNDPKPPSRITQAYILQRYISACGSGPDSQFPIKFNGSIFTVEPALTENQPHNADWRKWGGCFWWQNTRLPYYPMLAAGDFPQMNSLFSFYERAVPGAKARAKLYHNAEGVYFPETMTTFGAYSNGDYGWNRAGIEPNVVQCPWWQWAWQQNLELTQLMLDYAAYSGDRDFLVKRALPMARETLNFYNSRFKRDAAGKLRITPTQAAETYWHEVVNDAPTVGGLIAVCDMLLALPADVGTAEERAFWKNMREACPPLPMRTIDGKLVASPAESFRDQRNNVETPELYPCFPFRLYGVGKPNLPAAIEAYQRRQDKSHVGWTQDGILAAMLGLTDDAKADLLARCANTNKKFRFPAMWGPNFDWLPDQCHGGNLQSLLQLMLLQCDKDEIRLLPAWPKDWNVTFKLHAPRQTIVECDYRDGAIRSLTVTPESRRKDVVLPAD